MKKCLKLVLAGAAASALALGGAGAASAATLTATTDGQYSASTVENPDHTYTTVLTQNFYTVSYQGEGGPSIASITYDLSADITGGYSSYFNFDTNQLGTNGPDLNVQYLHNPSGVHVLQPYPYTSTDGGYNPSLMPNMLTFTFDRGAFQVGNTFSFGADAEWVGGNGVTGQGSSGGDFGAASIPLKVTFYGGNAPVTGTFAQVQTSTGPSTTLSSLSIAAPAAVPLPGALWLFGSGLVGLAGLARHRKTA
ncbi:MAG: PEP-CTERM sorting domain-containing protein [Gammaproteobacteria bacterium]